MLVTYSACRIYQHMMKNVLGLSARRRLSRRGKRLTGWGFVEGVGYIAARVELGQQGYKPQEREIYSVTIDTSTTNTRVFVWQDNRILPKPARRLV
ncbi:MAG: hypothetical protein ACSLEN_00920 [Candidatus Malihini olakiniferum]